MTSLISNLKMGMKIGEGHFGEVFSAQDEVHGSVAVKFLKKQGNELEPAWLARKTGLLREAQNLKKARHRNVVEVFHLVERPTDDAILFVMERCAGGCLLKRYQAGPLALSLVRKVATDVTLGLAALHARGMLHRDIKPSNILQDGAGAYELGDFGLVTDNLMFGYGSQTGYGDHLAPEVWHGGGTSVRTDIWALGITLYRLLHGAEWYGRGEKPSSVVKDGGYADSLDWLPHVPSKWRRTLRTMLRDEPADRYQSANQVLQGLADLPTDPVWLCEVRTSEIRWSSTKPGRKVAVTWMAHSERRHSWKAWSEPTGNGRSRELGSSRGIKGKMAVVRELEGFFTQK